MKSPVRKRITRMYEAVYAVEDTYRSYAEMKKIGYLDFLFFYEMLSDPEPFTQKKMCDLLEISKTTMNSLVKRWMAKGYLRLEPGSPDARTKVMVLTESGSRFAHDLVDPIFEMEEEAIQNVSDEDLEMIESIVAKYANPLSALIQQKK